MSPSLRRKKKQVREYVEKRNWKALLASQEEWSSTASAVFPVLFDQELLIRWRAIEAFGILSRDMHPIDAEAVREILRKLFWGMNDESGAIIWSAPEALGEILHNIPPFITEYGRILASFIYQEPFEEGVYWAIARMATVDPKPFEDMGSVLTLSLGDPSPTRRAHAAIALSKMPSVAADEALSAVKQDDTPMSFYDFATGEMRKTSIAQYVAETLG